MNTLHIFIFTLISFLHIPTSVVAAEAEDSIATPTFPPLHLPSDHADINAAILSMNFQQAETLTKKLIAAARRKKESTEALERISDLCKMGESGLRGVDRVTIVDSTVVDKTDFLAVYPLADDIGTLTISERGDIVQFQTQINSIVFRPEKSGTEKDSTLHIVRYYLEDGRLTEPTLLVGLGIDGDVNYPYLMPDGQTFYFAARSPNGYGNYDLYATRYDSEEKQFYQAENLGYPYNSYANDYMLVIDEDANLGWFASDRYQPAGKVCVYTFIPNQSRRTIDYEATDIEDMRAYASLHPLSSIPLTEEQTSSIAEARKRMNKLTSTAHTSTRKEFEFVLNDAKTCYHLADFTSVEAQKLCKEWLQKSKNLASLHEQLEQLRKIAPSSIQQILNLEKRIAELQNEVHTLEKRLRTAENTHP